MMRSSRILFIFESLLNLNDFRRRRHVTIVRIFLESSVVAWTILTATLLAALVVAVVVVVTVVFDVVLGIGANSNNSYTRTRGGVAQMHLVSFFFFICCLFY